MVVMLERWNDDKMDALAMKVDGLDRELHEQRRDLREHRKETKEGFEALHRALIQTTVAVLTAFLVGFSALIGLVATPIVSAFRLHHSARLVASFAAIRR